MNILQCNIINILSTSSASIKKQNGEVTLFANGISATFRNGILIEIKQKDEIIPLNNGPLPVGMKANFKEGYEYMQGNDACYIAKYEGGIDSIVWRMSGDGLLGMEAVLLNDPKGHGFEGASLIRKYIISGSLSLFRKRSERHEMDGTWPLPCMEESYKRYQLWHLGERIQ